MVYRGYATEVQYKYSHANLRPLVANGGSKMHCSRVPCHTERYSEIVVWASPKGYCIALDASDFFQAFNEYVFVIEEVLRGVTAGS